MFDHKPQIVRDWGWLNPAAGMFTNVMDLAKLQIMLFNSTPENDYLSPIVVEEMFSPDYFFPDGETFLGTPWEMFITKKHDGYVRRVKTGSIYGYFAYTYLIPELKLGYNALCTKEFCERDILKFEKELVAAFNDVLLRKGPKRLVPPPDGTPFIGNYFVDNIPSVQIVRIYEEKGQMYFEVNGVHKFYLNYKGQNSFEILSQEKDSCMGTFLTGVNHERIFFDSPSNGTSAGFTFFGIHPNGIARFRRK